MGPSTFNFAEAAELSESAGAAFRVADVQAGVEKSVSICVSDKHFHLSELARQVSLAHRGAAHASAAAIWACFPLS